MYVDSALYKGLKLVAAAVALTAMPAASVQAYPFDLKLHKAWISFDGMDMNTNYLKSNLNDGVILFNFAPTWSFRNEGQGIAVQDSDAPSASIIANYRSAFTSKTEDALKQEIISDAIGDLGGEVGEPTYETFVSGRKPKWKGYSVKLVHRKFGQPTCRAVVYFQINETDVIRVKIGTSPEKGDKTIENVKRWISSFRDVSKEEFEKLQKGT